MSSDLPPARSPRGDPMRCPACDSRLVEVERMGVMIDACPSCRGVWLDRGELDRILVMERTAVAQAPDEDFFAEVEGRRTRPPSPARAEPRGSDEREARKRRRRSLLEDLLDF